MNHNEKLVDTTIVERLVEGSFESLIEKVDEAVLRNLNLFGADDVEGIHSWTYPSHVIVANENAEFFRAEYAIDESGEVTFGKVERQDIPVKEAKHLGGEARRYADEVVLAVFDGDDDRAQENFESLFTLVANGVRVTAESVEDAITEADFGSSDWMKAVDSNAVTMREFVGAASNKDLPKPRFDALIAIDDLAEEDEERHRKVVRESLRRLRSALEDLNNGIALARQIDETYALREGDEMAASHFIEFSRLLGEDLDAMIGLVEDAIAISEDGTLKSLARIHDAVAEFVADAGLASAFAEKFSTKFTAPEAA